MPGSNNNSHQPALKTLRGFEHNYEVSRQCREIIEIVENNRSRGLVSPGWYENQISHYWPSKPFSHIPEELLARASPKRGNGLLVVNRWVARGLSFLWPARL
jgi:hypothetical protein